MGDREHTRAQGNPLGISSQGGLRREGKAVSKGVFERKALGILDCINTSGSKTGEEIFRVGQFTCIQGVDIA